MPLLLLSTAACTTPPAAYDGGTQAWERTAAVVPQGTPERLDETSTLTDQLRWATAHNPGVQAAAQRWRAALERVPQTSDLPDPMLTFGWFVNEAETRAGPMDWRIGLSQSFPWFGTLDLRGQVSVELAESAREQWIAARLKVAQEVRDAWFELAYVAAAIDVTSGHRELLVSWEKVARMRYSTALGTDADVIRAQVELGKLDDRLRTLEDLRRPLAARLNAALNRPADAPLPEMTLADHDADASWIDRSDLFAALEQTNPELRSLRWAIDAAEHQIELADKKFFPDFSLGLDYTSIGSDGSPGFSDKGKDALAITTGFNLPLRRTRLHAAKSQATAEKRAATAELTNSHNRIVADLEFALYHVRDAERRMSLFKDTLVPKGEQSISSTTVAYQAGDTGFLDLIDAERVLLEFQLAAARAQADQAQALAVVERLTGRDLPLEN